MMVPVISVACRQFKTRSFPVSLHANVFFEASICRFVLQFFTVYHWHTKLPSIRLELFNSPKLVLRMYSIGRPHHWTPPNMAN